MILYSSEKETMIMSCAASGCPQETEFDGTFLECVGQAKKDGWYITKSAGAFYHFCPDHARAEEGKSATAA